MWLSLPKDFRKQLIANVYCTNCSGPVTITDFIIVDHPVGVMLDCRCGNCISKVARVVEMDE
nr:hypothetical protein [Halobacillus sp. Nhm2S1]